MATTTRSGQNIGAALTRLHLVEEKLKHLDPNAGGPDLDDVLDRLTAAEVLLQRYWMTLFEGAAVQYGGSGISNSPADTVVFDDGWGGLVRAIFGSGSHGMASNDLIEARTVTGRYVTGRIQQLEGRADIIESKLAVIESTLADHTSRIQALEWE